VLAVDPTRIEGFGTEASIPSKEEKKYIIKKSKS
jgi:hypothetical protein